MIRSASGRCAWALRALFALVVALEWSGTAHAQTSNPCIRYSATNGDELRCLDLQLFTPPANVGTTFTIDQPGVPRHLSFVFGANLSFGYGVLDRVDPVVGTADTTRVRVVDWIAQAEISAAMGLFEIVELGVILPFALNSSLVDASRGTDAYGGPDRPLSDLRATLKVPLLRGDFALAARGVFSFPTGDDKNFLGTGYWTAYPSLVTSIDVGPLVIAGEVGYRLRRRAVIGNLEQDDEIQMNLGVSVPLGDTFSIIGETQLRIGVGGRTLDAAQVPMDANAGIRIRPMGGLSVDIGVGTGILDGYGAPLFRGFALLRYATETDQCAFGPEDFDGFEDGDFCADPDNDADGIEDSDDACPNDAEDVDGFLDTDGCPEPDNDADGVLDPVDQCPTRSEDIDGFQDTDGCPEEDNDEDGIADGSDRCPMEPEDRDDFQDEDGCPEPGPERATVTVTDTRILISERIYFDFDRDTIRSVSMPLLDQVAQVVMDLPRDRRIRVEGYTDNAGEDRYNTDLSYRRARAVVEYLSGRGVPRTRLTFEGYGSQNPVAPNDSPEGRALNRRVEFTILGPHDRAR